MWQGKGGRIETLYPKTVPVKGTKKNKPSPCCIYNKSHEDNFEVPYKAKKETDLRYKPFYDAGYPITRVEKTVKSSGKSITELIENSNNPFASMKIYWPHPRQIKYAKDSKMEILENESWRMFLDSVRFRGVKSALGRLNKSFVPEYRQDLNKCLKNIFSEHNKSHNWKKWWSRSIKNSGLL